jgi:aspartyl-tRNA(Asn)/glutamyl-tRNA(Gln) amidotransferase subunit C
MSLTREDVARIAHLARLALTDDELEHYGGQLSAILEYAARLEELDLSGIEPSAHGARQNVMRDDVVTPSLPRDEVLFNVAASADGQFLIQSVLE